MKEVRLAPSEEALHQNHSDNHFRSIKKIKKLTGPSFIINLTILHLLQELQLSLECGHLVDP